MQKDRLTAMRKALGENSAFDALGAVRGLIPDDGTGAQQVVVYGFACILEANSAGLSILFDRFDDDELEKIKSSLDAMGTTQTYADFRQLHGMFTSAIAKGMDRFDASDWVAAQPETQLIDRKYEAHADELEQRLLEFCKAHIEELASG